MAKGDTKTNQYLDIAANGTRADLPTDTCCETRSQTLIREVAERIMDVEDEVEELKNNPDVVDIVATYADLQAYDTQHLTDKDIIRVLQDETHDGESTYYRYNKQSGTWTYVGTVGDYYTKTAADAKFQDKLTAGSNITISDQNVISATDTTYSNFTGTDGTAAGTAGLVPAPATTDAGKFLKADGTWDTAGSAINVVQTTGTSTTDVMSQNAVTSMVFADPSTREAVRIGNTKTVYAGSVGIGRISGSGATGASGGSSIAIGSDVSADTRGAVSIGKEASIRGIASGAIALGACSKATSAGEMNIGSTNTSYGYNSSKYRLLTGLYDPQSAHDAATKGYVDPTTDSSVPTTATVGRLGQIQIDTTTATAYMCVEADDVTPSYTWKQITA